MSHDPSEIILIYWFAAPETFIIIINVGNFLIYFVETFYFRIPWWKKIHLFIQKHFFWNRKMYNSEQCTCLYCNLSTCPCWIKVLNRQSGIYSYFLRLVGMPFRKDSGHEFQCIW